MDSDQGKLFIGGISWETTEEKLKDYFENYGQVLQTVIMKDKLTGKPRGFGFVVFADPSILDRVLQDAHTIDGRTVEAKRALSRGEQQPSSRSGHANNARNFGSGGDTKTKKIFVGGLPPTLSEEGFRQYFESYGNVTDVVVMYDQQTQRPRGFGFVSFDDEDAVDRVLHKTFHDLDGKQVEVKRALPKDSNPSGGGGGRSMGGGAGGGGGYQGGGGYGGNSGSYDGRMDSSNRYMQSQNAGGGFPPYASSGYNAPGYGYGPSNNSMGYGGYGSYGGPGAAGYGNPNVPSAGYGSGPPGAPRSSWSSQTPSGYGAVGAAGQSPGGGASGYGAQGYGYGGYGGTDGSYANQAAYGAVGGRAGSVPNSNAPGGVGGGEMQGGGGGYMGGSYGDPNGNVGYGNQGWTSQTSGNYGAQANSQGGPVGYGGGYGAPTRQVQQQ